MADNPFEDELWQEFHSVVNMSSAELQAWLTTQDSAEATEVLPDQGRRRAVAGGAGHPPEAAHRPDQRGRRGHALGHLGHPHRPRAGAGAGDEAWRRRLMAIGHDPLREID